MRTSLLPAAAALLIAVVAHAQPVDPAQSAQTATAAQGPAATTTAKRDGLPDMLIAIPELKDGKPGIPFVTDAVKRGRVKDIDFLFLNKRTTALAENQSPSPHVKVVLTFVQREGCEAGEPFNAAAVRPVLACGVATSGRDDRTAVRVPLQVDGTTWTIPLPLAGDDNASVCTLRVRLTRSVARGEASRRYCFDVTADGVPAADPVIIIRDGGN